MMQAQIEEGGNVSSKEDLGSSMLETGRLGTRYNRHHKYTYARMVRWFSLQVDVTFLERQIAEKKAEREEQERKDLAFAKQMIKDSNLAERRRIGAEIDLYRQRYQRFEDRREYDLNDPEVLKKQLPPRPGDGQPVGLSSAQKFEGEDLEYEERKKIMAAQKNSWLEQQVQERKAAEEERKKAEAAYMVRKGS
ncbi:hypothetical protein HF086_000323 [Spodoptera exigua]|uniref:Uncharacterized protein n=1 Tax=Spodoptera exigua TaxID=7107 RepID=A0A922MXD0_SPOEX|nr:hypothetical protein HF086_000323 [Spodoptera exigua]